MFKLNLWCYMVGCLGVMEVVVFRYRFIIWVVIVREKVKICDSWGWLYGFLILIVSVKRWCDFVRKIGLLINFLRIFEEN